MVSHVFLSLGSNSGDRYSFIERAVEALTRAFALPDASVRTSEPFGSMPEGFVSENRFVNVGVMLTFDKPAGWTVGQLEDLLHTVKAVEKSISSMPHRNPDGSYRDREIDIDIIAVDDVVCDTGQLRLPHPAMSRRAFVLVPMMSLMADWKHPLTGLTPAEMLECLK